MFCDILSVLSDNLIYKPYRAYWVDNPNKTTFYL